MSVARSPPRSTASLSGHSRGLLRSGGVTQPDPERVADAERTTRALFRLHHETAERFGYQRREDEAAPVVSQPAATYLPPPATKKFLSAPSHAELVRVLSEVREINESMVGMVATVASVLLAGDERATGLRLALRRWAEDYCRARLARPSPRDDGDPAKTFCRLTGELRPWFETLAFTPGTVHFTFLCEVLDHIPWLLFKGTLARWFREVHGDDGISMEYTFDGPSEEHDTFCFKMASFFKWATAGDAERVIKAVLARGGVQRSSADEARARLGSMASDIQIVRPFLVGSHNPEKCYAEVAPGLTGTWFWGGPQRLGMVAIHQDERERVAQVREQTTLTGLGVDHEGLVGSYRAAWLNAETVGFPIEDALAANVAILSPLHRRLLEVWEKVDLDAIHRRMRGDQRGADEPPTEEEVVASVVVADAAQSPVIAPEAPTAEVPDLALRRRLPTLRLERFLAVIGRLDCDVRQGKGSEVVVHRRGGKHAIIGRHTRNREVPPALAHRVLHQLGVSRGDWLRALEGLAWPLAFAG